jgi:hypothetical protein
VPRQITKGRIMINAEFTDEEENSHGIFPGNILPLICIGNHETRVRVASD